MDSASASVLRLILEIDIGELLAGTVLHDEAGVVESSSIDHGGGKRRVGIGVRLGFDS